MKLLLRLLLLLLFFGILTGIIAFARGYRFDFPNKSLTSTGIIAVSAFPKTSKVYVNGELKGVTDINISLPPGIYDVEVKKDGYTSWKKNVRLKGELVINLDVLLYPLNPTLSPLTNLSVSRAIPIYSSDKVILFSEKDSEDTDGIYLFESAKYPIAFFPPLKLIVLKKNLLVQNPGLNFSETEVIVSPDTKEAILTFQTLADSVTYLMSLENENNSFFDISPSKETLIQAWQNQKEEVNQKILQAYPEEIAKVATDSFHVLEFSKDQTKLLYQAKTTASLPIAIDPPLIAANQTEETRDIQQDLIYVYDKKEDRNYLISNVAENCQMQIENCISWFPDSKHLVLNEGKKLSIVDFDYLNKQTVYSGTFIDSFFKITGDGKILLLTNFNPEANPLPDLYAIGIK